MNKWSRQSVIAASLGRRASLGFFLCNVFSLALCFHSSHVFPCESRCLWITICWSLLPICYSARGVSKWRWSLWLVATRHTTKPSSFLLYGPAWLSTCHSRLTAPSQASWLDPWDLGVQACFPIPGYHMISFSSFIALHMLYTLVLCETQGRIQTCITLVFHDTQSSWNLSACWWGEVTVTEDKRGGMKKEVVSCATEGSGDSYLVHIERHAVQKNSNIGY